MDKAKQSFLNKELGRMTHNRLYTLQDFLDIVNEYPEIQGKVDGIYCGTHDKDIPTACATATCELDDNYWLHFGWYADPNSPVDVKPRVEWAYISAGGKQDRSYHSRISING